MDTDEIKALLEKYRQGACTNAETELIEEWLASVRNDDQAHFNTDFIDEQLSINKNKIDALIEIVPASGRRTGMGWLAIAASVIVVCSIAIWAFYPKKQQANVLAKQNGIGREIKNGWVYVKTEKGITGHLRLPDGSMITLDASSSLRYPVAFTNHKRPVYLDEGEALFDVAKDKTSPFTVYTPKFATTALGTAFNIRSYAKEHKVSISLIHGKIKVEDLHPAKSYAALKVLLPHQQLVLNKQSGEEIKSDFEDETPITSWTNGVLAFNDATTDEVINSIENRFNVSIKNNSGRTNWSYTGTFKNEPVADVIQTVCLTEGITCTINKNNITLN